MISTALLRSNHDLDADGASFDDRARASTTTATTIHPHIEKSVPIDQLLLDADNPRLASGRSPEDTITQEDIIRRLWTEMSVDEVALSIAANGYYPDERLLVIPDPSLMDAEQYIVIEGNRRLAAVQLLTRSALRQSIHATDLPRVSNGLLESLLELPISIYPDRRSLWTYLGFRHINGTKPWDAFSKARYVASVHDQFHEPLDDIARKIGDKHATVKRLYRGIKILDQAESEGVFRVEDRLSSRFYFSHLYTAVDQSEFQRFLGIKPETSLRLNPVPRSKLRELGELLTWLYGRKATNTRPIISIQNPDLGILRETIANRDGLSALRSGLPLYTAQQISTGDEHRFRESITRAGESLREARGTVLTGYRGETDLMESLDKIIILADKLRADMQEIKAGLPGNVKV